MYSDADYSPYSEWDAYMLRYGGYCITTLEGFEARGIATYYQSADAYVIKLGDGTSIVARNSFA